MPSSRRQFLRDLVVAAPLVAAAPAALVAGWRDQALAAAPWDRAAAVLGRIVPPRFPDRHFVITRFGAVGDGRADCTSAIRRAIAACHAAGGGRVVVPDGRFVTGGSQLASGVKLHLAAKATLAFSRDAQQYLPVVLTRWEGTELMNYSPFIYAYEAENIAITGTGTLDGQADADNWWNWRGDGGGRSGAAGAGAQPADGYGRARRAGQGADVRRGPLAPAQLHPAVPQPQRPHRGRHDRQFADVGDPSGAVPERHRRGTSRSAAMGRTTTAAIRSRAATC